MSITTEITRLNGIKNSLQTDRTDITNALINRGVTVPSGSGFDNFASLIGSVPTGYKAQYIEEVFVQNHCRQYLEYELDFEPKAMLICVNEAYATLQPFIADDTTLTATNKWIDRFISWYTKEFAPEQTSFNLVTGFFYSASTDGAITSRTSEISGFMTVTQQGNRYNVKLGKKDTTNHGYRFCQSGKSTVPIQIMFIGG